MPACKSAWTCQCRQGHFTEHSVSAGRVTADDCAVRPETPPQPIHGSMVVAMAGYWLPRPQLPFHAIMQAKVEAKVEAKSSSSQAKYKGPAHAESIAHDGYGCGLDTAVEVAMMR
ncbi:hypothetical protein CDD82_2147 [Ophiocordyceps australis]|uniref:Uncharacterized protein n=1 Tax=Ophiocordyceps australis TaxID=1399860 RepID=A0A2C5Y186_9HYPO|nr:hypothetical protein CDD82_2147 [Ophiocordyceps australis]